MEPSISPDITTPAARGECLTPGRPGDSAVICAAGGPLRERLGTFLHEHGCQLWPAVDPSLAPVLAAEHDARRFVLPADAGIQSGWLTCAKLTWFDREDEARRARVVVIVPEVTPALREFAHRVKAAAVLPKTAPARKIAEALFGVTFPSRN